MPYPYNFSGFNPPFMQNFPQNPQLNGQNVQFMQNLPQPQQHMQNGFIYVQNVEEARNYPVAPGNSVTFKDENSPYMYTKTMGFSQLDRPVFEKYRLIKEDNEGAEQNAVTGQDGGLCGRLEALEKRCSDLEAEISNLKKKGEDDGKHADDSKPIPAIQK